MDLQSTLILELVAEIAVHIRDGVTWKSLLFTCKRTHASMSAMVQKQDSLTNHLMTLVMMKPDAPWKYSAMSVNRKLSYEYVQAHLELGWNYEALACHVKFEHILKCPKMIVHGPNISCNDSVTFDDVLAHPEIQWDYSELSSNPNITSDIVFAHPHLPWDMDALCHNPSMTVQAMVSHPGIEWDMYTLSWNQCIPIAHLLPHVFEGDVAMPNIHQNFCNRLCIDHQYALALTFEARVQLFNQVLACCDTDEVVTLNIVLAHQHIKWNYDLLIHDTPLTDIIATSEFATTRTLPVLPWNFDLLPTSSHVPIREMELCTHVKWNYDAATSNWHLTYRDVLSRPNINWRYDMLSYMLVR